MGSTATPSGERTHRPRLVAVVHRGQTRNPARRIERSGGARPSLVARTSPPTPAGAGREALCRLEARSVPLVSGAGEVRGRRRSPIVAWGDRRSLAGLRWWQRGLRPRTRGPRLARARDGADTRGGATGRAPLRGDGRLRVGNNGRRGAGRPRRRRPAGADRARPRLGVRPPARVPRLRRRRSQLYAGDEHAADPTPPARNRREGRDPCRLAGLAGTQSSAGLAALHQARERPVPLQPRRVRGRADRRPAGTRSRVRRTLARDRVHLVLVETRLARSIRRQTVSVCPLAIDRFAARGTRSASRACSPVPCSGSRPSSRHCTKYEISGPQGSALSTGTVTGSPSAG